MASIDFTKRPVLTPAACSGILAYDALHLEKISCSDMSKLPFKASDLVGKRVCFDQQCPSIDDESAYAHRFVALVLGFSLGVSTFGLSDSLYVWQEGCNYQEFVDITSLSVVSVLT
ncbi:Unknown protein sequence [Pseudomonas cannabina pv. alisalensis]|uniref:Uncharacterized protein n=2 Tax=Pseudomonas cannabina TaxID=86840 RepID=A0AB37QB28_PSECA|nr:hypothetical protein [Pseudomonas cannabina]KPW25568.1 Unknown protein sequence [Pseudomonas cannabina pv. alisalensis]MBM0138234.1 hypothetical protein [Pseudomonas cannabina pv. alisalensis]RMN81091.1 hypothetical protein ALQ53_03612 [Pseudomonas cannabina]